MSTDFHIANLPIDPNLDELSNVFSEFGEVKKLDLLIDKNGVPRGTAHLAIDLKEAAQRQALIDRMMGYSFGDSRIYITPTKPTKKHPIMPEDETRIGEIARYLDETDHQPIVQLRRMVQFCGFDFIRFILEESEYVESQGGLLVGDRSRRRTFGGVFFHIARHRLSPHMQRVIFINANQKGDEENQGQSFKGGNKSKQVATKGKPKKPVAAKKGDKQQKGQPKPTKEAPPKKLVKPSQPASDPVALQQAQEEFQQLRQAYAAAQGQLESLKTLPPAERKSGLFSATREVVNIQKQMTALVKQYPELGDL